MENKKRLEDAFKTADGSAPRASRLILGQTPDEARRSSMPLTVKAVWKRTALFEGGAVPMLMGGRGAAKTALFPRRGRGGKTFPDASGDKVIRGLGSFLGEKDG